MEDTQNKIAALLTKLPFYSVERFILPEATLEILTHYGPGSRRLWESCEVCEVLNRSGRPVPEITCVTSLTKLYGNDQYRWVAMHHGDDLQEISYSVARINLKTKELVIVARWSGEEVARRSDAITTLFDLFVHLNPEEPMETIA